MHVEQDELNPDMNILNINFIYVNWKDLSLHSEIMVARIYATDIFMLYLRIANALKLR